MSTPTPRGGRGNTPTPTEHFGFDLPRTISGGKPERIRPSAGSGLPNFPGERKSSRKRAA